MLVSTWSSFLQQITTYKPAHFTLAISAQTATYYSTLTHAYIHILVEWWSFWTDPEWRLVQLCVAESPSSRQSGVSLTQRTSSFLQPPGMGIAPLCQILNTSVPDANKYFTLRY